jgi:hypothetical protein
MKPIRAILSANDEFNLRQQIKGFKELSEEEIKDLLLKTMAQIMVLDNQIRHLIKGQINE